MTKLIELIYPYAISEILYHTDKSIKDRDDFFSNADSKKLGGVFSEIKSNFNYLCGVAHANQIKCYLKKYGRNSGTIDPNSGGFTGIYFSLFYDTLYKKNGSPNVAGGGKLFGIDINEETMNFQLFHYDSDETLDPLLNKVVIVGDQTRGALRPEIKMINVNGINESIIAAAKKILTLTDHRHIKNNIL